MAQNKQANVPISSVPRYQVNLDEAPDKRWRKVIADYKDHFKQIESIITDLISQELGKTGTFLKSLISFTMATITKCGAVYYKEELEAIANQSNMSLGLLVVMQLIYEASAHCTSIVCNDQNGAPIHIRTMDWQMSFLRPITIEVEFCRNNKPVCIATSWAGYVGILTGMRYGAHGFSVSVNFRVTADGMWQNLKQAMSGSWPIGFLVRDTLTDAQPINYASAQSILRNSALISPVYFTMSGYNKHEGCLITRNRESDMKYLHLTGDIKRQKKQEQDQKEEKEEKDENEYNDFVVQTNIDHWSSDWNDNIMWSIQRRSVASEALLAMKNKADYGSLWELVSEHPICNEITVYGTLMSVHDGYFETRLPHKTHAFIGGKDDDEEDDEWITCRYCARKYHEALNAKGECVHSGTWHAEYSDCSKLQCAWGLNTNIGKQHWGCCYEVQFISKCKNSDKHVPMPKSVKLGVADYK